MNRRPLPVVTSCDGCGACCTSSAALPVSWYLGAHVRMGNPDTLPPAIVAELHAMLDRFRAEGFPADGTPCVWYDAEARRCRHYEHRPRLCRDAVKVGGAACLRWRRDTGIDPVRRFRLLAGRLVEV